MWCPMILSLCKGPDQFCILLRMKNTACSIVPYQKFSGRATLLLKRKLQHVGHKWVIAMWITSGLFSGSSGSTCRCDPLSTLPHVLSTLSVLKSCCSHELYISAKSLGITCCLEFKSLLGWDFFCVQSM